MGEVDNMEKSKLVKNLKIFSAVVVLSVSSYNLHDILSSKIPENSIELQYLLDFLQKINSFR